MTVPTGANLYTQGFGSRPENVEIPTYQTRAPGVTDTQWPLGKRWIDTVAGSEYSLCNFSTSNGVVSANWSLLGTNTGALNTLTGDSGGAISPSAGNITLAGTAGQIATTGSGSTITFSLIGPYTPSTYTAHGVLIGEGTSPIVATAAGTSGQLLIAATGADPAFATLTSSGSTITVTGGANTLNIDVTAPLNVAHGGTGRTTLTAHSLYVGNGTSAINPITNGTTGQALVAATGADPAFGTLPVAGGGTGAVTLTGVLTGNGTSAVTANSVTQHGVLLGGASNAVSSLAAAATGTTLMGSTGADPAFTGSPSFSGSVTAATGLTVTAGGAGITGTTNINTTGAAVTSIGTGGTGATNIGNATGNTAVTGSLTATTTLTATLGDITATNGNLVLGTAGNKIISTSVASTTTAGANSFGTVTLVGGTATVATTAVTASSIIMLTRQGVGSTGANPLGLLSVGTITAATSFVINAWSRTDATALQASDVSSIGWMIIN